MRYLLKKGVEPTNIIFTDDLKLDPPKLSIFILCFFHAMFKMAVSLGLLALCSLAPLPSSSGRSLTVSYPHMECAHLKTKSSLSLTDCSELSSLLS